LNAPCLATPDLTSDVSAVPGPSRNHAFLYVRCAVRNAGELFKLSRPLPDESMARLTRRFRTMMPLSNPEEASERIFSVYNRLLEPTQALDPAFLRKHERWFESAMGGEDRMVRLNAEEGASVPEPEADCEFLYLPGLKRCYTLVWRWLPVLGAGGPAPRGPIHLEDCNFIQDRLRHSLGLEPGTLLELYPSWVEPRRAESIWARDKVEVRSSNPWSYRFKPWEETPA